MKKTQSIIASAFAAGVGLVGVFALASCSNKLDSVEGVSVSMDNEIRITAMLDNGVSTRTKTLSSDTVTTANISAFYMEAYNGSDKVISIAKSGESYTTGKFTPESGTVGSLTGEEKWTDGASNTYYWPSAAVKFMAIACSDGTQPDITIASEGLSKTGFQVEASGSSYAKQKDYIAAVTTQKADTSFTVALKFQHLLSRLSINMWAPQDKFTHTSKLEVVSFGFESVNVRGDFSYTGASTYSNFLTSNWTPQKDSTVGVTATDTTQLATTSDVWDFKAIVPKADTMQNIGSKLTAATPWLNVIPGSNVAGKLVVCIKLTPYKSGTTTENPDSAYYKVVTLDNIPASVITTMTEEQSSTTPAYLPGYEYIYNLKVTGRDDDEGKVDQFKIELESVSVNIWNSTTAGEADTGTNVGSNTLQDIIEKAEAYSRINLLKSAELKGTESGGSYSYNYPIEVKKSCTLNLNNQAVTVAAPGSGELSAPTAVFTIDNDVRFVITDESTGKGGSITNNNTSAAMFNIVAAASGKTAGTVIIRGGMFSFDPSAYIEGTTDDTTFPKIFTQDFTDPTTGVAKVRTTTVTLSSGTYTVSQTITDKNENNNVNA